MTDRTSGQPLLHAHVVTVSHRGNPPRALEGCCHVVLGRRETVGRKTPIDRLQEGASGTGQCNRPGLPLRQAHLARQQSRNLNWGPVLQVSLIRALATGLIGKGLA